MPISSEPNFGFWKIQLVEENEKQVTTQFEVKKYVLPKFEVILKHSNKVWIKSQKITASVCAM